MTGSATIPAKHLLLAGCLAFGALGLLIGRLTLRLNPELAQDWWGAALLTSYFALGYGLAGAGAGAFSAITCGILERLPVIRRAERWLRFFAIGALTGLPLGYYLALPDAGILGESFTRMVLDRSARNLFLLGAACVLCSALTGVTLQALRTTALAAYSSRPPVIAGLALLAVAVSLVSGIRPAQPKDPRQTPGRASQSAEPAFDPAPVVLLCIDGLDPKVVGQLGDAGLLPTFERLKREGVWGELESMLPAYSPRIWTTIVTGKHPREHGIEHFVFYNLPGIRTPVKVLPRLTGLNYSVIPRLERLPGMPPIRTPYRSMMRRAPALWEIAGRHFIVGVYRWLVTWPVEPVNGFNVAQSVVTDALLSKRWYTDPQQNLGQGIFFPDDIREPIAKMTKQVAAETNDVSAFFGSLDQSQARQSEVEWIRASLGDPTYRVLPWLRARFEPRLTLASFYSCDAFQHRFGRHRGLRGGLSGIIDERYRYTDARLGEFLATLEPGTNVVIVSDHGFDFRQNDHRLGPPGMIFGYGPAFKRGHLVEGLSVLDMTPMILHILGLPLAKDMAGAETRRYRAALEEGFLDNHQVGVVETYGITSHETAQRPGDLMDEDVSGRLKALGYIQ